MPHNPPIAPVQPVYLHPDPGVGPETATERPWRRRRVFGGQARSQRLPSGNQERFSKFTNSHNDLAV